jgi:hypothetical protein
MPSKQRRIATLEVLFDTSALHTKDSHNLVSAVVRAAIEAHSNHRDLVVHWYLPEIVVLERTFQMQTRASDHQDHVEKLEKLLRRKLGSNRSTLQKRVDDVVKRQLTKLKLKILKLDASKVDWPRLWTKAAYRQAPFDANKQEKGFRDALIIETFSQLMDASSESASRIAFVCHDPLARQAAAGRVGHNQNVKIVETVEDLVGHIAQLASKLSEEFVSGLLPRAIELFSTLRAKAKSEIEEKFQQVLRQPRTVHVKRFHISKTVFDKKQRGRVHWITYIEYSLERVLSFGDLFDNSSRLISNPFQRRVGYLPSSDGSSDMQRMVGYVPISDLPAESSPLGLAEMFTSIAAPQSHYSQSFSLPATVVPTTSDDVVFAVQWSAALSGADKLRAAKLETVTLSKAPWM